MEYGELCKKFGIKLKYYRLSKNFSQDELAEKIGVDSHYISDIECGRRNITFKTLNKIANSLNTDISKFFIFE